MKNRTFILLWAVMLVTITTSVLAVTMQVQVRDTELRPTPSFLSRASAALMYGDRVTIISDLRGWYKVSSPKGVGWVHGSALSAKEVKLAANTSGMQQGASSEELALAGKGFSKEVESEFKEGNKSADFSSVDRMEKITITAPQKVRFLVAGGLQVK